MAHLECSIVVENVFGPIVTRSCLDGFDFTLLFEESILTIAPLIIAGMKPNFPPIHEADDN